MTENNTPIEYIEWEIEFFYNTFQISKDTMIPRLETETLVRKGIEIAKKYDIKTIIDIGTGSGTIPTSIGYHIDCTHVYATDISEEALKIADINLANILQSNKKYRVFQGDLLQPIIDNMDMLIGISEVLISANLPYVREGDNLDPEVLEEPHVSLFGGPRSGFELYEKFYDQLDTWSDSIDKKLHVICEFGNWHRDIAEEIFLEKWWKYEFFEDGRGFERFVYLII